MSRNPQAVVGLLWPRESVKPLAPNRLAGGMLGFAAATFRHQILRGAS